MDDRNDYERGFIDGMSHQAKSSVDKAVNAMSKREWVGLTDEERRELRKRNQQHDALMLATEQLLKEKNNGPR